MRVAVISDIHANLHALEAVVEAIEADSPDAVWCLGDLVGYGPMPNECCAWAVERTQICLAGNHDLGALDELDLGDFSPDAAEAAHWTRDVLTPEGRAFLESLGPSARSEGVAMFHASPRDPVWEYVFTVEQARDALQDRRVPLTLIGHTHIPFSWRLTTDGAMEAPGVPNGGRLALGEGRWLVNPGSVGQPRDRDARASWALYDPEERTIEFRRTPYDVAGAQNAILEAGLPSLLAHRLAEGK
jgi:diadenosine tetraphosphatase ApaH/serine/threonine PP2A family protein phosphatase